MKSAQLMFVQQISSFLYVHSSRNEMILIYLREFYKPEEVYVFITSNFN